MTELTQIEKDSYNTVIALTTAAMSAAIAERNENMAEAMEWHRETSKIILEICNAETIKEIFVRVSCLSSLLVSLIMSYSRVAGVEPEQTLAFIAEQIQALENRK